MRFHLAIVAGTLACAHASAQSYVYPVGQQNRKPVAGSAGANGYQLTGGFRGIYAHTGVDLSNGLEGGAVVSANDGVVIDKCETTDLTKSDPIACNGFGNRLIVSHSGGIYSVYGHMKHGTLTTKAVGENVSKGEKIGEVDCTGDSRSSTGSSPCASNHGVGSHLHFEIKTRSNLGCGYLTKICRGEDPSEFDSIYKDPLKFIEDSQTSKPPAQVQYLKFVEGNPRVPGDGIRIVPTGGLDKLRYEVTPASALKSVSNGLTVSVYTNEKIDGMDLVIGFTNLPATCAFSLFGDPNDITRLPSLNGASGIAAYFNNSIIQQSLAHVKILFGCSSASTANMYLDAILPYDASSAPPLDFVTSLDAAAIGYGPNQIPTSATPPPN